MEGQGWRDMDTSSANYDTALYQTIAHEQGASHKSKVSSQSHSEKLVREVGVMEISHVAPREGSSSEEQSLQGSSGKSDGFGDTANPRKRKLLTADEKTKQNRDRNRDHAKNTRLRKKAYVIKLKELVDQLTEQKTKEEFEHKVLGDKLQETHLRRKNAVRLMLKYRSTNMTEYQRWVEILDENVVLTLPITPYRSFHKMEIVNSCRVLRGIDSIIADNCSLALMVESLGWGTAQWREAIKLGKRCTITYHAAAEDLLAAGDLIMCKYLLRTEGHEDVGVQGGPVIQHGMLQCKFNRDHKILSAEFVFDVMGFMQQLQRASCITPESSIVPNTLEMALQPTREARAIIRNQFPHHSAIHVNEAWTLMIGHSQSEAEGISLSKILRVDPSQQSLLQNLSRDVSSGRPGSVIVISGVDMAHRALLYVKMFPLTGDSDAVTHFLVVVCDLPLTAAEHDNMFALKQSMSNDASSTMDEFDSIMQSGNIIKGVPFNNYFPNGLRPPQGLGRGANK